MGRPTDFTDALATAICEGLVAGQSLRSICAADDMPDKATVFRWLAKHDAFRDQYARAREAQADAMLEEIIHISDDGTGDAWIDDEGNVRVNSDVIARSKLRVDTRKWAMSKMAPKKYGEKIDLEHSGRVDADVTHHGEITVSATSALIAEALGIGTDGASEEPGEG